MSITELLAAVKAGQLDPVYLFLGKEDYLEQQIRQAFKQVVPEEQRAMNVASYDMETTPLAVALDDALSAPFFGDRRVVLIEQPVFLTGETKKLRVDHDIDGLIQYLSHPEPNTTVIFMAPYDKIDGRKKVVKLLKKVATTVTLSGQDEHTSQTFVRESLKQENMRIEEDALVLLTERTDASLTQMMNELLKLKIYVAPATIINRDDVAAMVSKTLNQNVFDLVTDVLNKDVASAVTLYRELLLQKEEPLRINAILQGQFRLLIQIKTLSTAGYSQGSLASMLKVHPYRVKLALQTQRRFKMDDLTRAYRGLFAVEEQMKSTAQPPELLFELFMSRFVAKEDLVTP